MWISKCWSKIKNLCKPYIEMCENSSGGLNWIAISTWTFLCLQVSDSCRKQGSWHGTVRALQHRQKSKYWYLHFGNTMCMCILTINKVRELWQKISLSTGKSYEIFNSREQFLSVHMTNFLSEEADISSKGKRIERGSTTAFMALYWQLFPGEPQHRANSHGRE